MKKCLVILLIALDCMFPAQAQFTIAIPPNAIVVNSTTGSSGTNKIFWICDHDTLTGSGIDMTYFMELGSSFSGSGISKNAYLKTLASISGSGIDDSIWHVAGSTMLLNPAYDSLCTAIVFDYSDAPLPGCPIAAAVREDPRIIRLKVYPNPATDYVFIKSMEAGLQIKSVRLADLHGRECAFSNEGAGELIRLDVSWLPAGTYTLLAETSRGRVVHFVSKK